MSERADAEADIMAATCRALCRHGYADLTMQDIADESSKSKAALHYHYDSKRALLLAFLEHLLDRFEEQLPDPETVDPVSGLEASLDTVVTAPAEEGGDLRVALLEIKAQAPYDEAFRDRLAEFDATMCAHLTTLLSRGVDRGDVRADVDPAAAASFLTTGLVGAQTRAVTLGDAAHPREQLAAYVTDALLAGEAVDL